MNNYQKQILSSCQFVCDNATHVKIDEQAIKDFITNHPHLSSSHWLSSNPYGLTDLNNRDLYNFLLLNGSICCLFWGDPKWTLTTASGSIDGAFAQIYGLMEIYKAKGHLDFTQITFSEYQKFMRGNVDIPMLEERYQILHNVSATLNTKMQGNFYDFIKDVTTDTELMEIIISNFPSFQDTREYQGHTIHFYKLAELLTSDILHIRALKENIATDCTHLTACADYKIPQVLRGLGIITYDEELAHLVDNRMLIPENSPYEVEIRASEIIAIQKISEILNLPAITVNDAVWLLGQDKSIKLKPYHLTKTMSY